MKNVILVKQDLLAFNKISSHKRPFKGECIMTKHKIYTMSFARVYPLYIAKAEKKERTKSEVDEIIRWLTGYSQEELEGQLEKQTDFETFFAEAPQLNPSRDFDQRCSLRCPCRRYRRTNDAGNSLFG